MKKATNILAALMLLFSVSSFAADKNEVTPTVVKEAFQKDFTSGSNVSWEKKGDFYFVSFVLNDVYTNAAYDESGEMLAVSRKIETAQLPLSITLALSKKYEEFSLPQQATEVNFEGQTSYYLTLENDKKIVNLKCYSNGEITVESRSKK